MRFAALSALVLATVATPAFAQTEAAPLDGVKVAGVIAFDSVSSDGEASRGFGYGGSVGYDIQSGNFVAGLEGEATFSTAESCVGAVCLEAGRDLYAGGRLGVVVSGRSLVYLKAGYTNARAKLTTAGTTIDSSNLDGIRGGVGVESGLGKNAFVRLEYRYSNYEADVSRNQGVLAIGMRF